MAKTMAKTTRTVNNLPVAIKTQVRTLRDELAQMDRNTADITKTYLRIADANGWGDPRLALMDADTARIRVARRAVLDQIDALLGKTAAHAAA